MFVLGAASPALRAQSRALAIRDATILTGDGQELERATVVIQEGKISAVGKGAKPPMLSKKIRARGKYVTPGLIDVWSTVGLRDFGASDRPTGRAADAFDRFAEHPLRDALAGGVTTAYVPALGRDGFTGAGAVVRLIPGGKPDEVILKESAAFCATLGGDGSARPISRITSAFNLRKLLEETKAYREAQEFYQEDLEEYEKKLKERAEKQAAEKKDGDAKPEEKKAESKPTPPRPDGPRRPPGGPPRGPRPPRPGADPAEESPAASHADEDADSTSASLDAPLADEEPKPAEGEKPAEKKDELKKPLEPEKDREKEALLKLLDGDAPLRVYADRPDDILNALDIAREFNLRLIIDGGRGAHHVAEELAKSEVPVILSAGRPPLQFSPGAGRFQHDGAAGRLRAAGVNVYCGSGPSPQGAATRLLALHAAEVLRSADADVLKAITSDAAKLLGIADQTGRVAVGLSADLVVWSDHPLRPGARVERVFVAGEEVFTATPASGAAPAADADAESDEKPDAEPEKGAGS